jgi:hypothetical protein
MIMIEKGISIRKNLKNPLMKLLCKMPGRQVFFIQRNPFAA